jgi:hypothetical protein
MELTMGTRLGPYEITGSLGAGGMGEVFLPAQRGPAHSGDDPVRAVGGHFDEQNRSAIRIAPRSH